MPGESELFYDCEEEEPDIFYDCATNPSTDAVKKHSLLKAPRGALFFSKFKFPRLSWSMSSLLFFCSQLPIALVRANFPPHMGDLPQWTCSEIESSPDYYTSTWALSTNQTFALSFLPDLLDSCPSMMSEITKALIQCGASLLTPPEALFSLIKGYFDVTRAQCAGLADCYNYNSDCGSTAYLWQVLNQLSNNTFVECFEKFGLTPITNCLDQQEQDAGENFAILIGGGLIALICLGICAYALPLQDRRRTQEREHLLPHVPNGPPNRQNGPSSIHVDLNSGVELTR